MRNLSIEDKNYLKLKKAGILPRYINSGASRIASIPTDVINRVPFSKNYQTYHDYVSDKKRAVEIANQGLEVPDSLVAKLHQTKEELGIDF